MSTASAPLTALVPVPTALDLSDDSAITTLQRAAIGPVHPEYYLPIFERFEAADRAGPSWNWAAGLCTLNWMLFRQLWWPALLYVAAVLAASLLVFGLGPWVLQFSDTEKRSLLVALATFAFLVPGVFGNAMLHGMVRRRIARALAASSTLAEACVLLKRQSSSRQRLMGLAAANVALAGLALAAWLALPGDAGRAASTESAATAPPQVAAAPASAPAASAMAPATQASTAVSAPAPAAPESRPAAVAASAPASGSSNAAAAQAAATPASQPEAAASSAAAPLMPASVALTPAEQDARAASMAAYVPRRSLLPSAPAAAAEAPASSTPAARPAQAAASAPPAGPKSARKVAAAASAPAPAASGASATPTPEAVRPYFINVGLFAEEANARRAFARLQEAGLPALQQELAAAKGTRWRVRAGPFPNREESDAAAGKIRALQLEAVVVRP